MIVPKRLSIHNFFVIEDIDVELEKGTYFITGENRDDINQESNGTGKSVFCSSIVWCLFEDVLIKGVKKNGVIGSHDSYTEVALELDIDGQEVEVIRCRNHPQKGNSVELWVDGEDRTHATSKVKTTALIEQKLGISRDVLYYCAFSHEDNDPLVSLTSSQLNKVVSQIIGTSRYDDWIKDVRARGRDIKSDRDSLIQQIGSTESQVEEIESDIEREQEYIDGFWYTQAGKAANIESSMEELNEEKQEFEDLLEGEAKVREEYESLEAEAKQVEELNGVLKSKQRELDSAIKRENGLSNKLVKIENQMGQAKDRIDNLTKNPSGECEVCGNFLSDSKKLEEKVARFQKEFNKHQAKKVDAEVDLKVVKEGVQDRRDEIKELQKKIDESRGNLDRYHKLGKKIDSFDRARRFVENCQLKLTKLEKQLDKVKAETPDHHVTAKEQKEGKLETLVESLDEMGQRLNRLETDAKACKALEAGIKDTKAARFNSFIIQLQNNINHALSKMTDGDYHCRLEEDGNELTLSFTSSAKDGYLSYWSFSKGERARLDKAAATALNSMMNLGFLVDDEGLDGLDDVGINSVLDFVIEVNRGKVFFFVGHQRAAHDYFRNATNLHLIKEDGATRLEVR